MKQLNFIPAFRNTTIGEDQPDLNQVATFIEKNADNENVKKFVGKYATPFTTDSVSKYLTDEEDGKKLFNSMSDSKTGKSITTALENYKEKTLPSLVEAEYQKRHPEESAESKANRELTAKVEALEIKNHTSELRSVALEAINEAKLPFTKLVDKFVSKDVDATLSNIQAFETIWNDSVEARAKELVGKSNGRDMDDHEDNDDSLDVQLVKAEKKGDKLAVIKLKNQISKKRMVS